MEGQTRPSVDGLHAPSTSGRRSASTGRRWSRASSRSRTGASATRTCSPARTTPTARVEEITEDETDAEVIFNGVGTVWNGIKLMQDKELALACYKVYNDWIAELPGVRARAVHLQRHAADDRHRRRIAELHRVRRAGSAHRAARVVPERVVHRSDARRTTGSGPRRSSSACRSTSTRSSSSRSATSARRSPPRVCRARRDRAKKLGIDVEAGELPGDPVADDPVGRLRALPDLKFVGYRGPHRVGPVLPRALRRVGAAQPARLEPSAAAERVLPPERARSCTSSTRSARTTATTSASPTSCGVPTSRTPRQHGRSTTSSASRSSSARARRASEIERIMWKNAADLYKLPYDDAATAVARRAPDAMDAWRQHVRADLGRRARRRARRRLRVAASRPACATGRRSSRRANGGSAWFVDGIEPVPLLARPPRPARVVPQRPTARLRTDRSRSDEVLPALYDPVGADQGAVGRQRRRRDPLPVPEPVGRDQAGSTTSSSSSRCVRAYNDWIAEFCAHDPDRLIGAGEDPDAPASRTRTSELARCVDELGLRGAVLDAWPSGAPAGGEPGRRSVLGGRQRPPACRSASTIGLGADCRHARRRRASPRAAAADGGGAPADGRSRRVRPLPRPADGVRARRRRLGVALDGVLRQQLRAPEAPVRVRAAGSRRRVPVASTSGGTSGSRSTRTARR